MKTLTRSILIATLVLFFAAPTTFAQTYLGVQGGYDLEIENAFIGAEARLTPNVNYPIQIVPSVSYYFVDSGLADELGIDLDQTFLVGDLNAIYRFGVNNQVFTPYAGAGLSVSYAKVSGESLPENVEESSTDFGINLIGGAVFGSGTLQPFAQARYRLLSDDPRVFSLGGGVLYRF